MKKFLYIVLMILILAVFLISGTYTKTVNRSFQLDKSSRISLKNINGDITITTYSGNTVKIEAVKQSKSEEDLSRVKIIFDKDEDGLNIFPRGYENRTSTSIQYDLKIPEHMKNLFLKTVNGAVTGEGLFGNVEARTVNGSIEFTAVMNDCNLGTVNGSIKLYQTAKFSGDITIKSVNGSIKVELDRKSSVTMKGSTLNGRIKSDFSSKISKGFIGSSISGVIGSGTQSLKVKTVNGSISIYRK